MQWIATEAREHKVESGQIEIQSAGNVSRIVGAKFQATPGKHLIFMAPDVRAQVLQQAQLVDGKGFVPSRSMILEILPSGELEYRYVLGHFDGAEAHRAGTLGESTPDERGFLHCEWYAAIAESDRRPPTTIAPVDRVGLCAFVTQTSGVDAVMKLEARGENRKPTRIVGSFEASGALRLWAQP